MRQEINYGIPIVVILALIVAIASDYCLPTPTTNNGPTISTSSPFNPFCYVDSFKPEAPEFQTSSPVPQYSNILAVNSTGTSIGSPSVSASPSPSPEIPES